MLSHCSFVVGASVVLKACEFSTKIPRTGMTLKTPSGYALR
jgi:hypothetical protein